MSGASKVVMLEENSQNYTAAERNVKENRLQDSCALLYRADILGELQSMALFNLTFSVVVLNLPLRLFADPKNPATSLFGKNVAARNDDRQIVDVCVKLCLQGGLLVCVFRGLENQNAASSISTIRNSIELSGRKGSLVWSSGPSEGGELLVSQDKCQTRTVAVRLD
eukprot:Filipodium_phascolosomae@DN4208_c0_g1_i1.p1